MVLVLKGRRGGYYFCVGLGRCKFGLLVCWIRGYKVGIGLDGCLDQALELD